jgi:hypothetical protein
MYLVIGIVGDRTRSLRFALKANSSMWVIDDAALIELASARENQTPKPYLNALPTIIFSPRIPWGLHVVAVWRADRNGDWFGIDPTRVLEREGNIGIVAVQELLGIRAPMEFYQSKATACGGD